MKVGIPIYIIGLGFSIIKIYYDTQSIKNYEKKLVAMLGADITLLLAISFSLFSRTRAISAIFGIIALLYFYTILAFGGRGSAKLACMSVNFCENSVSYSCTNINNQPVSGVFFLLGTSLKIIGSTLILRTIWMNYKRGKIASLAEQKTTK